MTAWLQALWAAMTAPPMPVRAALLNTGELVLLDARGNAQVLSVGTTETIRSVLDGTPAMMTVPANTAPLTDAERDVLRCWGGYNTQAVQS